MKINHNNFLKLAFNIAKVNLGKTRLNPSVGCVVVKNNSVISSGYTSRNGRPHAEFNALKYKKILKILICTQPWNHVHTGVTPPCTNIIAKKGIKRVFFSFNDTDKRTAKKSKKKLVNKKLKFLRNLIKI